MKTPPMPPLPQACVLLFNITPPSREQTVCRWLCAHNITARVVRPEEQGLSLGRLTGMPGCIDAPAEHAAPFSDEMLVMSMFTGDRMDEFLQFFRSIAPASTALKAIVTAANAGWSASHLHRELSRERKKLG